VNTAANFSLRTLDDSDLPALLELYRACEDFLALGPCPRASLEMVRGDVQLSQENGGTFQGIFDPDGRLIGVADWIAGGFEGEPATAFIELLMIAAPNRSVGLGRAVVAEIERRIRQAGAQRIELGVQVNNLPAQRFWLRRGYRSAGPPRKFADGTTAIRMRKVIHEPA
jgi:ribosomal protein S18 acetylase RimI-like enzyme